jgi:hypothetical protein
MKSTLGGEEASVALFDDPKVHGDGAVSGWGCWAERDGSGTIAVEEIGSQSTFYVGEVTDKHKGAYGAAGRRKLFVDVVADARLGPSKVCPTHPSPFPAPTSLFTCVFWLDCDVVVAGYLPSPPRSFG